MYCIQVDIPNSLCEVDDELKAIYYSKDSVCIWFLIVEKIEIILLMKPQNVERQKEKATMKSITVLKLQNSYKSIKNKIKSIFYRRD